MPKRSSLPVLVVVALVALVVGSIGTAVAAPSLTKGKVKAIAAKVVTKKASSLTVANAATAVNATLVDGQSADSLATTGYTYELPRLASADSLTFVFPGLPAGSYQVSYSAIFDLTTNGAVGCQLVDATPPVSVTAGTYGQGSGGPLSIATASGFLTKTTAADLVQLNCVGIRSGAFTVNNTNQVLSTVTFVRLGQSHVGWAIAGRAAATGGAAH